MSPMSKIRSLMRRSARMILRALTPFLAPLVGYMARTGVGTNRCLQYDCLPMPVHYYSPVPDIEDLKHRNVWQRKSNLTGVAFSIKNQLSLLNDLGKQYGHECKWPSQPTSNPYEFNTKTTSFSYGCAAALHSLLRYLKPKRVIEIGSGNSSKVISSALSLNSSDANDTSVEYTIIDPYPSSTIEEGLPNLTRLIKKRVELIPIDFFSELSKNDILFVDSGHNPSI